MEGVFWLAGGWSSDCGLWCVSEGDRRQCVCVCVFVCRPLEAPINISLMVYVLPVGIDPCFYFPISSHLWLVRVVWHSYMHKHTFPEPMFVCAFGGWTQCRLYAHWHTSHIICFGMFGSAFTAAHCSMAFCNSYISFLHLSYPCSSKRCTVLCQVDEQEFYVIRMKVDFLENLH